MLYSFNAFKRPVSLTPFSGTGWGNPSFNIIGILGKIQGALSWLLKAAGCKPSCFGQSFSNRHALRGSPGKPSAPIRALQKG